MPRAAAAHRWKGRLATRRRLAEHSGDNDEAGAILRAEVRAIQIEIPWKPGDRVKWRDHVGLYRRDVDDEHGEVVLDERLYRVRKSELRPG